MFCVTGDHSIFQLIHTGFKEETARCSGCSQSVHRNDSVVHVRLVYKVVARHAFASHSAAGINFLFFWRLARNPYAVPPRAEDVLHHGANRIYAFCLILQSKKMDIVTCH